jgi:TatD DNase family protein
VTLPLPAIDAHAHVLTDVSADDLRQLGAFVFAVTREDKEWEPALRRHDNLAIWGVGVHPGVPAAIAGFDAERFAQNVDRALLVGEVGLDGRSKVGLADQRPVFDAVLDVVLAAQRPISIHSVAASGDVLKALRRRPVAAPILHWWRGNQTETEEAVELGCFFSLNGAEAVRPKVIDRLPRERVLTETDFPHSRRSDPAARQPAAVATIEDALMERWNADRLTLRRQLWRNLGILFDACALFDRLPAGVQDALLTAGTVAGGRKVGR